MSTSKTQAPATKKVVGNKATELVIGTGISKLLAVVSNAKLAVAEFDKLSEVAEQQTLLIVNNEDRLQSLDLEIKNKKAQNMIEIEQAYRMDQRSFVDKFLNESGNVIINAEELQALQASSKKNQEEIKKAIDSAVGAATSAMEKNHKNELVIVKLEHEKKEAGNIARITQLESQITFLGEQAAHWKAMLESQVKAETERSKHGAINTLNVGTGQNGK